MGMFDNIICRYPLPLSDKLKAINTDWARADFQTKDLDCSLSMYYINESGEIEEEVIEREYIPYPEGEEPDCAWCVWKEVKITNRYLKPVDFHGKISFYTSLSYDETQDVWVEFDAYFIYGKLDKIILTEDRLDKASELRNKEIFDEIAEKNKKPWPTTKRLLKPFGWHWFWGKMSRACYKMHQFFGSLQTKIIKHML